MVKKTAPHRLTSFTGLLIVLANMVGTGVFTSLGFQLNDLSNVKVIITLWILGGVLALAGAFSYAEVGASIKQSGGEYIFLSKLYHPIAGYLAGWVSLTVGFAAPIALSAIALVAYLPLNIVYKELVAISIIAGVTFIHTRSLKVSSSFQSLSTVLKLLLIVSVIVVGLAIPAPDQNLMGHQNGFFEELMTMAFAVNLIFVSYAYSGWNATTYIIEEFKNPVRSLQFSLIGGTLLVTFLYTLLQYVFLKHVPMHQLVGRVDAGSIAVEKMMGTQVSKWFGLAISLLLVSGISAMIWIGPRVTASMAKEHRLWYSFQSSGQGIPKRALWLQFIISVILIITGTFEQILIYCGVLLNITSMFVVAGVFILRARTSKENAHNYKSPIFPILQIFFLLVSLWMIVFAFIAHPFETIAGMSNLAIGMVTFYLSKYWGHTNKWQQK